MPFRNAAHRKCIARTDIVDLLTATVYGLVVLAVFIALDMWWLFPILIGALLAGYAVRALMRVACRDSSKGLDTSPSKGPGNRRGKS
ncbi:MAG: hypothetical protein JO044_07445 [Mycobacteriaceae bacterium]|nr:hypothetical protein [Mycobacteriaceae bacterium]MBV9641771.1 hypothetical protein [Mycobacteriaceae bacterium]